MKTEKILIRTSRETKEYAMQLAKDKGVTLSEFIRSLIWQGKDGLKKGKLIDVVDRKIESYFGEDRLQYIHNYSLFLDSIADELIESQGR